MLDCRAPGRSTHAARLPRSSAWLLALLFAAACGGTAHDAREPRFASSRYQITVVEGTLAARRPSGGPWHVERPSGVLPVLGGLIGLAAGDPVTGLAIGKALQGGGAEYPPSAFVELKLGPRTLATLPAGPTLEPHWRYPLALDVSRHEPTEPVVVLIRDAIDGGVIGQTRLTLGDLLGKPFVRLFEVGSMITLDLAVAPLPAVPTYSVHEYEVPSHRSARWLTEHETAHPAPGEWRRVPVLNGDWVRIRASGTLCPSSWDRDACFDAAGAPSDWQSYNYDEFRDAPHAALVGFYADLGVEVGTGMVFQAAKSGWLLLFVNDTDEDNNRGDLDVIVEVNPPDLVACTSSCQGPAPRLGSAR